MLFRSAYDDGSAPFQAQDRTQFAGTPQQVPGTYQRASPLSHVDQVRAPLLVLPGHGEQIHEYVQALRAAGGTVQTGADLGPEAADADPGLGAASVHPGSGTASVHPGSDTASTHSASGASSVGPGGRRVGADLGPEPNVAADRISRMRLQLQFVHEHLSRQ